MMTFRTAALLGAALWLAPLAHAGAQSLSYNSGQPIAPAYEGWEEDPDGSKYFLFGYMNRNWEEELVVPVGPNNSFAPGNPDQGQPTRFLPRRNRFVFRIKVPANWNPKDELVWTLTTNGVTEKAYASLREDYKVDDVVKASETGALGAGSSSPEIRANKPPVVAIEGNKTMTAKVGQVVDLVAKVTGRARWAEDFRAEGMLFTKLLLSPMPHARVRNIDTSAAMAMPGVKAILFNIFGGIMRCDIIAEGVVAAARELAVKVPLVVRLEGNNVVAGKKTLAESGLTLITGDTMADAAQKVVKAVGK